MSSQVERVLGDKIVWLRGRIRDVFRGYSDQEYLKYLAEASGQITPADRESYESRRLNEVCHVARMSLPNSGTDSVIANSTPIEDVGALKQELTRLRQLTPEQLNEEIRNDAVRWLEEHRL